MRLRLALLLAAAMIAAPGCAAAFEAYVAAVMPLRVSPSSDARPVTTMAANIPFNVLGCGRWCQVQYGGTMGYVPAPLVIPARRRPRPALAYWGFWPLPWCCLSRRATCSATAMRRAPITAMAGRRFLGRRPSPTAKSPRDAGAASTDGVQLGMRVSPPM